MKKVIGLPIYVPVALAILLMGYVFLIATTNNNPLHIYLLPENYVGEVEVTYEQADNPPLAKEGNSTINNIPKSGKLKTSSTMESGPVEVYYVDNQGQRKKVSHEQLHGVASSHGGDRDITSTFYIGTKEQYEKYVNQQ
jgi:hypothetical protein